jgi:hypothetical protein
MDVNVTSCWHGDTVETILPEYFRKVSAAAWCRNAPAKLAYQDICPDYGDVWVGGHSSLRRTQRRCARDLIRNFRGPARVIAPFFDRTSSTASIVAAAGAVWVSCRAPFAVIVVVAGGEPQVARRLTGR